MYIPEEENNNFNTYKVREIEKLLFKYKLREDSRSLIAIMEMKEDFLKLEEYMMKTLREKIANQNDVRN